jgi:hypothetical protein
MYNDLLETPSDNLNGNLYLKSPYNYSFISVNPSNSLVDFTIPIGNMYCQTVYFGQSMLISKIGMWGSLNNIGNIRYCLFGLYSNKTLPAECTLVCATNPGSNITYANQAFSLPLATQKVVSSGYYTLVFCNNSQGNPPGQTTFTVGASVSSNYTNMGYTNANAQNQTAAPGGNAGYSFMISGSSLGTAITYNTGGAIPVLPSTFPVGTTSLQTNNVLFWISS